MSTTLLRSTWVASTGSVMQTHCRAHTSDEGTLQTAVLPAHMPDAEDVHVRNFAFACAPAHQAGAAQTLPCWPQDCFAACLQHGCRRSRGFFNAAASHCFISGYLHT